jgi:hypothetical protein
MTKLSRISLYIGLASLLCALPAWSQNSFFGDQVSGSAIACSSYGYLKNGASNSGYDIKGEATAPECQDIGSATAKSNAKVGPPIIGASAVSVISGDGSGGTAQGAAASFDTAYLTPPEGYSEDSVNVTIKTKYTFNLSLGGDASSALWELEWYANNQLIKQESSEQDGHGTLSTTIPVTVTEGQAGFLLELDVAGSSIAGLGSDASCSTGEIELELPKGWTYKWASQ